MKLFHEVFKEFDLLKHPFYQAWNEGKLTRDQLATYATQYGHFIQLVSEGWQKAGEESIALEEQEHYVIWQKFGNSLGADNKTTTSLHEVNELVSSVSKNFSSYAGAIGALYAFEKQQPATSGSKLDGLRKHYQQWNVDETYFKIHETDFDEPALLEAKYEALSPAEKILAANACKETCMHLWNALSGIADHTGVECMN